MADFDFIWASLVEHSEMLAEQGERLHPIVKHRLRAA